MFSNIHFGLTVLHKATYQLKLTNKEVNEQIDLDGHRQTRQTMDRQTMDRQTMDRQTDTQTGSQAG